MAIDIHLYQKETKLVNWFVMEKAVEDANDAELKTIKLGEVLVWIGVTAVFLNIILRFLYG